MSITMNTVTFGHAVMSVMLAQHAVGVALRELDRAQRDMSEQLKFGNDPATTDGQALERFGRETGELASALIQADAVSPHCGEAMDALQRIQAAQRVRSPEAVVPEYPSAMHRVSAQNLAGALS